MTMKTIGFRGLAYFQTHPYTQTSIVEDETNEFPYTIWETNITIWKITIFNGKTHYKYL